VRSINKTFVGITEIATLGVIMATLAVCSSAIDFNVSSDGSKVVWIRPSYGSMDYSALFVMDVQLGRNRVAVKS